jgi:hypothetical protein
MKALWTAEHHTVAGHGLYEGQKHNEKPFLFGEEGAYSTSFYMPVCYFSDKLYTVPDSLYYQLSHLPVVSFTAASLRGLFLLRHSLSSLSGFLMKWSPTQMKILLSLWTTVGFISTLVSLK